MTARHKIEGLTNSWYRYAVFGAVLSLWLRGFGFFSLIGAVTWLGFNVFGVWFLGRRLLAKGSLTRALLVGCTGLFSVLGSIAVARMGWTFFHTWSLDGALCAGASAASVYMNVRSFRVLTDPAVKAYIAA